uniref:Neuropeptides B and W receptor 1 n=1 Tax=Cynoglossus semilaevis TaxID=244447 RepID=A0A3P8VCF2_CYNSE
MDMQHGPELHSSARVLLLRRSLRHFADHLLCDLCRGTDGQHGCDLRDPQGPQDENSHQHVHPQLGHRRRPLHPGSSHQHSRTPPALLAVCIYFLTVMSIDRYLVVLATVSSKRMPYRTYRAAKIISLCVWILVILIVMPFTVFAGVDPNDERKSCVLIFPSPEGSWFKASRIYTLILGFAIPVSTICILYTMMLYKLRNMRLNSNAKALDKAKKKVTVMVFIVLAVCLFCWTPFHLSTIVALTTDLRSTPLVIGISYFITSLSYANSCLNPFLYAFLDDSFRKAFKKMLECRPT